MSREHPAIIADLGRHAATACVETAQRTTDLVCDDDDKASILLFAAAALIGACAAALRSAHGYDLNYAIELASKKVHERSRPANNG